MQHGTEHAKDPGSTNYTIDAYRGAVLARHTPSARRLLRWRTEDHGITERQRAPQFRYKQLNLTLAEVSRVARHDMYCPTLAGGA